MIRRLLGVGLVAFGIYFALQIESGGLLFFGLLLLASGFWLFLGSLASFGGGGGVDIGSGGGSTGGANFGDGDD